LTKAQSSVDQKHGPKYWHFIYNIKSPNFETIARVTRSKVDEMVDISMTEKSIVKYITSFGLKSKVANRKIWLHCPFPNFGWPKNVNFSIKKLYRLRWVIFVRIKRNNCRTRNIEMSTITFSPTTWVYLCLAF